MSVLVCLTHTLDRNFYKEDMSANPSCFDNILRYRGLSYGEFSHTVSSNGSPVPRGVKGGGGVKRYREQCSRGFVVGYPLEVGLKNPHTE